ncbi:MAG: acetyl-CoA carboxylase carboxyltransferase subunit alpha [Desulfatiglandales bacterium]
MGLQCLDFERPIVEVEKRIAELKSLSNPGNSDHLKEISKLQKKLKRLQKKIFGNLSRWQKVLLSRHMDRPHALDYIEGIFQQFVELHGDRLFSDDHAILAGMAKLDKMGVFIVGHEKGRNIKERIFRNFGMANPEGYRKVLRMMGLAERFQKPLITFIDTPGAWPGIEAEQRGQAGAIAMNLCEMAALKIPTVSIIIGEGGSGGALALCVTDRILMMEYATFSVISPEGCAAILWKDETKKQQASEALKLTAQDALEMGLIDTIVPEPLGGAHRDVDKAVQQIKKVLLEHLEEIIRLPIAELLDRRYSRYRRIGLFVEEGKPSNVG